MRKHQELGRIENRAVGRIEDAVTPVPIRWRTPEKPPAIDIGRGEWSRQTFKEITEFEILMDAGREIFSSSEKPPLTGADLSRSQGSQRATDSIIIREKRQARRTGFPEVECLPWAFGPDVDHQPRQIPPFVRFV